MLTALRSRKKHGADSPQSFLRCHSSTNTLVSDFWLPELSIRYLPFDPCSLDGCLSNCRRIIHYNPYKGLPVITISRGLSPLLPCSAPTQQSVLFSRAKNSKIPEVHLTPPSQPQLHRHRQVPRSETKEGLLQ